MLVFVKGAGDIATGIATRLFRSGFSVVMSDLDLPTCVRRTVSFCEAIRFGKCEVEGIEAVLAKNASDARKLTENGKVAVLIDPEAKNVFELKPDILVDAILAKTNLGTHIGDCPIVIGVGPGFAAGIDCHAVIETKRGHTLGRVIYSGKPIENTGVPGSICGYSTERVIRASKTGIFRGVKSIGDHVQPGDLVGFVDGEPVISEIGGVLRGLLADDVGVVKGMKSGDVDPRGERANCFTCSDKALAVGGGVLEAIMHFSMEKRGF